jgi:putative transcriptional regulator
MEDRILKNIVKELREKNNLTQEALANELKVSRQTINSIETNKYVASLELALKIARFFNLKVEDIFKI